MALQPQMLQQGQPGVNPLGGLLQMLMQRQGGAGVGGVGPMGPARRPQVPPGQRVQDPRQRLRRLLMSKS